MNMHHKFMHTHKVYPYDSCTGDAMPTSMGTGRAVGREATRGTTPSYTVTCLRAGKKKVMVYSIVIWLGVGAVPWCDLG